MLSQRILVPETAARRSLKSCLPGLLRFFPNCTAINHCNLAVRALEFASLMAKFAADKRADHFGHDCSAIKRRVAAERTKLGGIDRP